MTSLYIKRLLLRHFRTYAECEIPFSPDLNCIQGKNGQGKTNLLEAIHVISTGRSFRTTTLSDLIAFGQDFFYIEAEFEKEGVSQTISLYYDGKLKKIQHNDTSYSAFHPLLGLLPSVISSPDDLSLIVGSPHERRRFLDLYIAQTDPLYIQHLGRYFKAMQQRNQLLKTKTTLTLSSWEEIMAQSAAYLVNKRQKTLEQFLPSLKKWVAQLSLAQDLIELSYLMRPKELLNASDLKESFQQAFQRMREKEFEMGYTLVGPHRDDLQIQLADKLAKHFSSQGQKRACLSALRFAQWECMKNSLGTAPLLGIDDFGIQLDPTRQEELKKSLSNFSQVFITSPESDVASDAHIIQVEQGQALALNKHL